MSKTWAICSQQIRVSLGNVPSLTVTAVACPKLVWIPPGLGPECVFRTTSKGHHSVLRWATAVHSIHHKLCMALISSMLSWHIDPSHSSTAGPSLWVLSPGVRKSSCRGRGETCRPASKTNPFTMYKVMASSLLSLGWQSWRRII